MNRPDDWELRELAFALAGLKKAAEKSPPPVDHASSSGSGSGGLGSGSPATVVKAASS